MSERLRLAVENGHVDLVAHLVEPAFGRHRITLLGRAVRQQQRRAVVSLEARHLTQSRLLIDSAFLRVPVIGFIMRTSATAMFSRSFSLLLASGVTIIEALRTCQDLFRNRRLSVLIANARENVIAGAQLSPGLTARKAFTPMLSSMVAIGERSGNLDETLLACAEFHEQRLAALIRSLSSLVEIAVIIIVGGIVGYVYIAFMMALYGASL